MRPSLGAFCLFVGTDLDPTRSGLSDSNIWHYGCNDIEAGYASAYRGRLPDKPFFFLTVPTLKDPDTPRAPEGYHTVELITFVPAGPFKPWFDRPAMRRGPAYEAVKAEMTERLLEGAEGYLPGLRDHIAVQESATPATVWHFVRGRGGGIYGPEHTADQMFHRRLAPPAGVPGLFLAGASVFGAGILTCLLSGLAAGQLCHWHLRARRFRSSLALPRLRSESRRALP
jgi:all-trans-retinol 13,14-reductase